MPYFVYQIKTKRKVKHLETFTSYRDAKQYVRSKREQLGGVDAVRMIFAKRSIEAEKLLTMPRDERVIGED